jgi:IS30 family transposase
METVKLSKSNIRRVTLQEKLTMKAMYDEGFTLQSIADYTNKSISTVKRHIYNW